MARRFCPCIVLRQRSQWMTMSTLAWVFIVILVLMLFGVITISIL